MWAGHAAPVLCKLRHLPCDPTFLGGRRGTCQFERVHVACPSPVVPVDCCCVCLSRPAPRGASTHNLPPPQLHKCTGTNGPTNTAFPCVTRHRYPSFNHHVPLCLHSGHKKGQRHGSPLIAPVTHLQQKRRAIELGCYATTELHGQSEEHSREDITPSKFRWSTAGGQARGAARAEQLAGGAASLSPCKAGYSGAIAHDFTLQQTLLPLN